MEKLSEFLKNSYTAYHAVENAKRLLIENGFSELYETEDWELCEGGKYFVVRDGSSFVAFTVGSLDDFSYKIIASHPDSPALKLKANPVNHTAGLSTLNVEKYGAGIWYTFFDRPLKIAGRVVKQENNRLRAETVESPYNVVIPSLAIHQNRSVNDKFSVNLQTDVKPIVSLECGEQVSIETLLDGIAGENVLSHELYLVNADTPYSFGANDEFFASPRIDNLTSVYASLTALVSSENTSGVCLAVCLDKEEIGSASVNGANGDFLPTVLKRIAYALRFDEIEYAKALGLSFMTSVDNTHAVHPNHPETSDPTNQVLMGEGIALKWHAGGAYITGATSGAIVKAIAKKANVNCQNFFNRSDLPSGSTLGVLAIKHLGILGADIGIPQLAMHSAQECIAKKDYFAMVDFLTAFLKQTIVKDGNDYLLK